MNEVDISKGDVLVFDLETKHTFDEVGSRNYAALEVSVLGYYSYQRDEYICLTESQLHQFENLLIDASLIVGFNSNKFDLPVLQPYLSMNVAELHSLDLLEEVARTLGFRVKLDNIAKATLGVGKTGHGLDAIQYYREGDLEKLKSYCLQDVKITKEILDHGLKHGEIFFLGRDGVNKKRVSVDWKIPFGQVNTKEEMQQYRLVF